MSKIENFVKYKHVRCAKTDRLLATIAYVIDTDRQVVEFGWSKVGKEEKSPKKNVGCFIALENYRNNTEHRSGRLTANNLLPFGSALVVNDIGNIRYRHIEQYLTGIVKHSIEHKGYIY